MMLREWGWLGSASAAYHTLMFMKGSGLVYFILTANRRTGQDFHAEPATDFYVENLRRN